MARFSLYFAAAILSASCSQGDPATDPISAMREHADHMAVEQEMLEAINEPNGGDYARAVTIIRESRRAPENKRYDIGRLVVGAFERPGSRRPPETLQQGLDMIEQSAVQPSDFRRYVPQQLRFIFERGVGIPADGIPIDQPVADCWHKLENGGKGDPARCVALRRERLPQLSVR